MGCGLLRQLEAMNLENTYWPVWPPIVWFAKDGDILDLFVIFRDVNCLPSMLPKAAEAAEAAAAAETRSPGLFLMFASLKYLDCVICSDLSSRTLTGLTNEDLPCKDIYKSSI
jgi:hypothetical protein